MKNKFVLVFMAIGLTGLGVAALIKPRAACGVITKVVRFTPAPLVEPVFRFMIGFQMTGGALVCQRQILGALPRSGSMLLAYAQGAIHNGRHTPATALASWQDAIVSGCKGQGDCGKMLLEFTMSSQDPHVRGIWRAILAELGEHGFKAVQESIKEQTLTTAETLDLMAENLTAVYANQPAFVHQLLSDPGLGPDFRLRLATAWLSSQDSDEVVLEHLKGWLGDDDLEAEQTVAIVSRLMATAARQVTRDHLLPLALDSIRISVSAEEMEDAKVATMIEAVGSALASVKPEERAPADQDQSEPPAEPPAALAKAGVDLAGELFKTFGVESSSLKAWLSTLLSPAWPYPMQNTVILLKEQNQVALVLKYLFANNPPSVSSVEAARSLLANVEEKDRAKLILGTENPAAQAALLGLMPSADVRRMWPKLKSEVERWTKNQDLPVVTRGELILMTLENQGRRKDRNLVRAFERLIAKKFECSAPWYRLAERVIGAGSTSAGFGAVVAAATLCPEDDTSKMNLVKLVNDRKIRPIIESHVRSFRAKDDVLADRLTELYGRANRIPGAALPPKKKKRLTN